MKRCLNSCASVIAYLVIRLYFMTLRITCTVSPQTKEALNNPKKGAVIMLWHDALFLLPALTFLKKWKQPYILISHSRDGDIPSLVAEKFQATPIRVRGGSRYLAVKEGIDVLKNRHALVVTPDGPRGPKRILKQGTLYLTQETDSDLFAFRWSATRAWTLSTWDSFRIPMPFTRCTASLIGPIAHNETTATTALQEPYE